MLGGGLCACAAPEEKVPESTPSITARVVVRFMSMGSSFGGAAWTSAGDAEASGLRASRGPEPGCYRA